MGFSKELDNVKAKGLFLSQELVASVEHWQSFEQDIIDHITDVIDDPIKYTDYYSTRLITILNEIYDNLYNQKIVLLQTMEKRLRHIEMLLVNCFRKKR